MQRSLENQPTGKLSETPGLFFTSSSHFSQVPRILWNLPESSRSFKAPVLIISFLLVSFKLIFDPSLRTFVPQSDLLRSKSTTHNNIKSQHLLSTKYFTFIIFIWSSQEFSEAHNIIIPIFQVEKPDHTEAKCQDLNAGSLTPEPHTKITLLSRIGGELGPLWQFFYSYVGIFLQLTVVRRLSVTYLLIWMDQ